MKSGGATREKSSHDYHHEKLGIIWIFIQTENDINKHKIIIIKWKEFKVFVKISHFGHENRLLLSFMLPINFNFHLLALNPRRRFFASFKFPISQTSHIESTLTFLVIFLLVSISSVIFHVVKKNLEIQIISASSSDVFSCLPDCLPFSMIVFH